MRILRKPDCRFFDRCGPLERSPSLFDCLLRGNVEDMPAKSVTDPIDELGETPFLDFMKSISADARSRMDVSKDVQVELVPVSVAGTVEVVLSPPGSVDALFAELEQLRKQKAELELREQTI